MLRTRQFSETAEVPTEAGAEEGEGAVSGPEEAVWRTTLLLTSLQGQHVVDQGILVPRSFLV